MEIADPLLKLLGSLAENRNARQMDSIWTSCAKLERVARNALVQVST